MKELMNGKMEIVFPHLIKMTFEEEIDNEIKSCEDLPFDKTRYLSGLSYLKNKFKENCLDRKRVTEAIDKFWASNKVLDKEELKKELGICK